MKNKVAFVTGGMGGIGTAICQHFFKKGAIVIAGYSRSHEEAKVWLHEQKNLGYEFFAFQADVTDFAACKTLIEKIRSEFKGIDILVNNAGIVADVLLSKMNLEQWQKVIQTNLDSMFNVTRQTINCMIERGYGRIINISSINGQKGQIGQTNYAAAKAGILGFTKSLAQEVAQKGITVNSVSPGYIATKMVLSLPQHIQESIIHQIPVGRLGKPEEIAHAVSFLAATESGFITGSNIVINGGQYLL